MVSVTGEDTPTTVQGGAGPINPLLPNSFILGGGGDVSMEELKRRRAIALALASRSKGYPKTLGEGLTSFGQDIGDVLAEQRLTAQEKAYMKARGTDPLFSPPGVTPAAAPPAGARSDADPRDRIAALYAGGPGGAAANPTVAAGASSPQASTPEVGGQPDDSAVWSARANAIGGIETGGTRDPYRTVGVPTKYGPALGRYGVVAANVPAWTQAALGQSMTPEQFLADPKAQDAVFQHRFGDYVNRYGEEGAARAWYGGAGQNNLNATDAFGRLTVKGYGQDYLNRLQGQRRGAPTSALETGTVSDAPPVTGLPVGDENPPTPTDIQPMPTMVAEAGTGATAARGPVAIGPNQVPMPAVPGATAPALPAGPPGPLDAPTPAPPDPTVGRTPIPPEATRRLSPPVAPQPNTTPSEEELRALAIMRKYPGDEQAQAQAQALAAFGKQRRDAIYAREVEKYKLDYGAWEKDDLAWREAWRNKPKTDAELRKLEQEYGDKQRSEELSRRLGGVSPALFEEAIKKSAEVAKGLPAASSAIAQARHNLAEGQMFTGADAELQLTAAKLKAAAGFPADPRIKATEEFRANVAPIIAQSRAALAGSTNISDADMRAATQAAGGDIKLERGSIENVLKQIERINTANAVEHQRKVLTFAGNDPDRQRAMSSFSLPMEQIVPQEAVDMLRKGVAGGDPNVAKEFDDAFHTPGLARRVLQFRR